MIRKAITTYGAGWLFLVAVVLLYLIVLVLNHDLFLRSLGEATTILVEVIPVLLLIFLLTFLANFFLTHRKADAILSKQSGVGGYALAIVLGIISMGPIYMWYPLLSELKEKGLKHSLIAVFLYNRAVKIPLIPAIVHYLGFPFLILSTALMVVFSVVNGYLISVLVQE